MIIYIETDKDSVHYAIKNLEGSSNDELCRAITHLELVKQELLNNLCYDYEVFEEKGDTLD